MGKPKTNIARCKAVPCSFFFKYDTDSPEVKHANFTYGPGGSPSKTGAGIIDLVLQKSYEINSCSEVLCIALDSMWWFAAVCSCPKGSQRPCYARTDQDTLPGRCSLLKVCRGFSALSNW